TWQCRAMAGCLSLFCLSLFHVTVSIVFSFFFIFFFSSRRRHTSFSRDWSSDVCSSDLHPLLDVAELTDRARRTLLVCRSLRHEADVLGSSSYRGLYMIRPSSPQLIRPLTRTVRPASIPAICRRPSQTRVTAPDPSRNSASRAGWPPRGLMVTAAIVPARSTTSRSLYCLIGTAPESRTWRCSSADSRSWVDEVHFFTIRERNSPPLPTIITSEFEDSRSGTTLPLLLGRPRIRPLVRPGFALGRVGGGDRLGKRQREQVTRRPGLV